MRTLSSLFIMNYYLHHECMPGLARYALQSFRIDTEGQFLVGFVDCHIEIYKLLHEDVAFHSRHSFHAKIVRIQVLPSLYHKHDYLWILDSKGRFCCWHPNATDLVSNTILWQQSELSDEKNMVFSGVNWQFQQRNTIGTIFYTDGNFFLLLHFRINEKGAFIDKNNIIKYALPPFTLRFAEWIKHSQSLFLVGLVVEQDGKTGLQVYDLEKGMGIHADSIQWRFQKINLLHFHSAVPGEILIVTYNEVSLHNYKSNSPLRNYRTRGNYGHGFYLGNEFYGHVGEELIVFSRDQLRPYGQVKVSNAAVSFSTLCFTHCSVLNQSDSSPTIGLQTYEGDFYLLKLLQKTFTITRIFNTVGPILEMCSLKQGKLFAIVSKQAECFQVSLLQRQTQIQTKQQIKLDQEPAQKIIMVNGGIYIIVCSQNNNHVYRLNRNQKYQFYFQLPGGSILAAQGNFLAYDYGIFQIDYQCFALSLLVEKPILLADATRQVIYYLDHEGSLSSFQNQAENPNLIMANRQNDYCWGLFEKNNTLLSSNLLQPKQIRVINLQEIKEISIKGHTLVTSLASISYKKSRFQFDQRIVVGYVDGQIHMHSLHHGDFIHATHAFEHYGSAPVSLSNCGDDTVLANYTNKQYLITVNQGLYQFNNVRLCHNGQLGNLFGYINKTNDICIVHNDQNQGILLKRISVSSMKDTIKTKSGESFSIKKLQEWFQTVPLLLDLDDRIIVGGCRKIHLIKLQSYKILQTFYHKLKEIAQMQQLKMGIILCGVDFQSQEHILILNQELELLCTFDINTKSPIRCLKTIEGKNQFYLAYDDSLTLYKISSNIQLQAVMGKKVQLHAYNLEISDELILINDPFKYLALLQHKESINVMGTYMPAYKIEHSLFFGQEILYIDERGFLTVITARMDNILDSTYKFTKAFSINLGAAVTAIYRNGDTLYYATIQGKIGVLKQITRDGFDALKKIQTETLVQIDQQQRFSYWQWRDRVPAHQRIIDGEMFPDNPLLRQEFLS